MRALRRRDFLSLGAGTAALQPIRSLAQPGKIAVIGVLLTGQPRSSPAQVAFEKRLGELGYIDGSNLEILFRSAEGRVERLPEIAAELIKQRPAVIVSVGPEATLQALHAATTTIPIVMVAIDFDPVAQGYAAGLARPGGNITGIFAQQIELAVKRLELLSQAVPGVRRFGVLSDGFSADQLRAVMGEAARLGLALESIELDNPPYQFSPVAAALRDRGAGAVHILMSPVFFRQRVTLADTMLRAYLPASFGLREWAEAGGLMSYGPNLIAMRRRAADYVHKILQGAKPAELPIEQPTEFELVINMKTAQALGLTVPPSLLVRADEVIE
jgi:putative ABC transport system substrate-binding protein